MVSGEILVQDRGVEECGLLMSYSDTISGILREGYGRSHCEITDEEFPSTETGEREVGFKVFGFGQNISSCSVEAEMKKAGYRPATMKELLFYGKEKFGKQIKYLLVGLGSVSGRPGYKTVGYLCNSDKRGLQALLHYCKNIEWKVNFRFLGVKIAA